MDYLKYIRSELLILIPVMYIIGMGLKKSKINDKWIPLILGIFAVCLSATWVLTTSEITELRDIAKALFTAITQGILVAGASVYANQLVRQMKK